MPNCCERFGASQGRYDGFDASAAARRRKSCTRGGPRRQRARHRQRLPRPRADPGQSRREPAGLLRRHHRRRGLRAALPRPAHRRRPGRAWCRAPTTAAPGAPTRRSFLYTVHDDAYRPCQVWRHRLGTPVADDVLVLDEPDERFELHRAATAVRRPRPAAGSESRDTSEVLGDRRSRPRPWPAVGRRPPATGVAYRAEHGRLPDGSSELLVVTNDDADRVPADVRARCRAAADQDHAAWRRGPARGPGGAAGAGRRLRGRRRAEAAHAAATAVLRLLPHDDLAGAGDRGAHRRFTGGEVAPRPDRRRTTRPRCWSATRPTSARRSGREVDLVSGERTETCTASDAPGHDPSRVPRRASDLPGRRTARRSRRPSSGTATPRSTGPRPALVYGYGAYEAVFEPEWDPALPSVLDRGVVFVHAHIRGGGEGGRHWYLDGQLGAQAEHLRRPHRGGRRAGRRRASSTRTGSPPAGSAPAACCRAPCSASGRTAGARWWPRCRSSTW